MMKKRKKLLVDPIVQRALVRHVVIYWLCCAATIEFLNLAWQITLGPEQPNFLGYLFNQNLLQSCGRLALGSTVVLPLIVWDTLRISNRFAGPVYRMRRTLRKIVQEGVLEDIQLRKDDFWHEFAEDLNAALARLANQTRSSSELRDVETGLATQPSGAYD